MTNYNDPTIWKAFLESRSLDATTPPPPKEIYEPCPDQEDAVLAWVHARSPLAARERMARGEELVRRFENGDI
jgi:hypothetical protein